MGFPFPYGLRVTSSGRWRAPADRDRLLHWAWATNAAASVAGSEAAMCVALQFGFTAVMIAGAAAYVLALAIVGISAYRYGNPVDI
jgi:hypothetical protein